jgi:hypothetical protein
MKVHWILLLFVIGAALSAPSVPAKIIEEKGGYTVASATDNIRMPDLSLMSSSVISQGYTDSYSTVVPAQKTAFNSVLSWGNSANSLALTIYAPDNQFGPYYDSADGVIDGRVSLRITRTGGLTPGLWWSDIYGYRVIGLQTYTYTAYAS